MASFRILIFTCISIIFWTCASEPTEPASGQIDLDVTDSIIAQDTATPPVLDTVVEAVSEVFPSNYWHPGTDGGEKYGYYNWQSGEQIIEPKFDLAGRFNDGYAVVHVDDQWHFIDTTGSIVTSLDFEVNWYRMEMSGEEVFPLYSNGLFKVSLNDKIGYVNLSGEVIIPITYDDGGDFLHGLCWVSQSKNEPSSGLINTLGEIVIPLKYDNINTHINGFARVLHNDSTGYINSRGEWAIPLQKGYGWTFFEGITFLDSHQLLHDNNYEFSYHMMDTNGRIIHPGPFEEYGEFYNGEATTIVNGQCVKIDTLGNIIEELEESWCMRGC